MAEGVIPNYSDEDKYKFVNSDIINKYELYGEGIATIDDSKFKTIKELKDAGCLIKVDLDINSSGNDDNVFPIAQRVRRKPVVDKPSLNILEFYPSVFEFNNSDKSVWTDNVHIKNPVYANPNNFEIKFKGAIAQHNGLTVILGEMLSGYVTSDFNLHLNFDAYYAVMSSNQTLIQLQTGYYVRGSLEIIEYDTDGTTILSKGYLTINFKK